MASGMTRREQAALLGIIALMVVGGSISAWRSARPQQTVYVQGQGRWEKLGQIQAAAPGQQAAAAVATPALLGPAPLVQAPGLTDDDLTTPGVLAGAMPGTSPAEDSGNLALERRTSSAPGVGAPPALDLNRATLDELDQMLPGIGPAKAQAILETRQALGGRFTSVEQLTGVKGIGEKTLERLRPYVYVDTPPVSTPGGNGVAGATAAVVGVPGRAMSAAPATTAGIVSTGSAAGTGTGTGTGTAAKSVSASAEEPAVKTRTSPPVAADWPIRLNTATSEQLQTIKGIGPVMAGRIIDYRQTYGPFRRVEDLLEVKGIGPKTLEKIRPNVRVD